MIADQKGLALLDVLTIISFAMQMENYRELKSQASTDDIFAELQRQDNVFLAQIFKNQEKILKILDNLQHS